MDIFTQLSDPHPFGSPNSFSSNDYNKLQEDTSSLSDAGTTTPPPHSDEEVACHTLATNRPKKRAGRKVFQETRHPVYRGVRRRNGDKWVCEMREPNNKKKRIWLGTYPTPEMAARAHDVAALALRGRSAVLNFADSAWRLPTPVSLDAKEIRRVANEGAQMFQPRQDDGLNEIDFGGSSNMEGRNEASNNVFRKEVNDNDRDNSNSKSNVSYVDEEAMLDMPSLLADMAQGLLLSPPSYLEDGSSNWDQMEIDSGFSLWSY